MAMSRSCPAGSMVWVVEPQVSQSVRTLSMQPGRVFSVGVIMVAAPSNRSARLLA